jgi:endonuclease III
MRQQSIEKLQKVLKRAGLFMIKATGIKKCLDAVFAKNLDLLGPGEIAYEANESGATDFVPGLLSLDYLYDVYNKGGKQALFDSLLLLPQIGVKSACCLMGFNMALPVFAVDTHVAGMAKLLG